MKKITVTLSDEGERVFNDIMYSLPKEDDGSGMCTQSDAINHALIEYENFIEFWENVDLPEGDEN